MRGSIRAAVPTWRRRLLSALLDGRILALSLALLLTWLLWHGLLANDAYRVERVRLLGEPSLSQEEVADLLGIQGAYLFRLNPRALEVRLQGVPYVVKARVRPDPRTRTVWVELQEDRPQILFAWGEDLYYFDREARELRPFPEGPSGKERIVILTFDPEAYPDLPPLFYEQGERLAQLYTLFVQRLGPPWEEGAGPAAIRLGLGTGLVLVHRDGWQVYLGLEEREGIVRERMEVLRAFFQVPQPPFSILDLRDPKHPWVRELNP